MLEIIPKTKLPKKHNLSQHLLDKADYFAEVQHYGILYYIPLGLHEKKLMGLSIRNGQAIFKTYNHGSYWEDFLRNIIDVLYMQVRDTVGSELHQQLSSELHDGFDKMFGKLLEKRIEGGLPKLPLLKS